MRFLHVYIYIVVASLSPGPVPGCICHSTKVVELILPNGFPFFCTCLFSSLSRSEDTSKLKEKIDDFRSLKSFAAFRSVVKQRTRLKKFTLWTVWSALVLMKENGTPAVTFVAEDVLCCHRSSPSFQVLSLFIGPLRRLRFATWMSSNPAWKRNTIKDKGDYYTKGGSAWYIVREVRERERQTDRQTDRRTDGQTDRQTV